MDELLPGDNQRLIAETKQLIARNTELIDRLECLTSEALPLPLIHVQPPPGLGGQELTLLNPG